MASRLASHRVAALTARRGARVTSTPGRCYNGTAALPATNSASARHHAAVRPFTSHTSPRPSPRRTTPTTPCLRHFSSTPTASAAKWTPPADPYVRPVVVIGVGNMGRRLAVMWASTSRPVILHDHSRKALDDSLSYIGDTLGHVCSLNGGHPGKVTSTTSLPDACASNPWMVIEALPELLDLKTEVLGQVDALIPDDCILATNSSSFMSRELAGKVTHRERLVNSHHRMPPRNICVEIMGCGETDPAVAPFLAEQMTNVGLKPIVVPKESQGFIFNRIWASMKRETLKVLSEGVGKQEDVDALFRDFFHAEKGPCERMDEVGLDRVRIIEDHYLDVKKVPKDDRPWLEWLEREYVAKGKLGEKSGDGLFTDAERKELAAVRKRQKRKVVEEYKGA